MNRFWRSVLIVSLFGNLFTVYVGFKALEYRNHINYFLYKYLNVAEEFGNRKVFESENEKFISALPVHDRVVFFGTQLTANWQLDKYFPDYEAINRGIEGQRVSGYLLRFVPDVAELAPEAVVMEISSYNFRPYNSGKEIRDYTEAMIGLARANNIRPIMTTVLPVPRDIEVPDIGDYSIFDSLASYNRWLVSYCLEYSIDLVDFNALLRDDDGYFRQNLSAGPITPNEKGYEMISSALSQTLLQSPKTAATDDE